MQVRAGPGLREHLQVEGGRVGGVLCGSMVKEKSPGPHLEVGVHGGPEGERARWALVVPGTDLIAATLFLCW